MEEHFISKEMIFGFFEKYKWEVIEEYTDDNNDNTSSDKKMQLYQGDLSLRGNITAYGFSDISRRYNRFY